MGTTLSISGKETEPSSNHNPEITLSLAGCSSLLLNSQQSTSQYVAINAVYNKSQSWKPST